MVFGFDLVGTEAAINAKKDVRHHPEGAADLPRLLPKMRSVFLRLPPRTPWSPHLHLLDLLRRGSAPHPRRAPSFAGAACQAGLCCADTTREATHSQE